MARTATTTTQPGAAEHPAVRRVLEASTGNLPQDVCDDLNGYDGVTAHSLRLGDLQQGWLLWVPDDPEQHAADYDEDVPAEVIALQVYARRHGCDYVLLDPDADAAPGLPHWVW